MFDLLYLQPVHYASDSFLHQHNILRIEKEPHIGAKCLVSYYRRINNELLQLLQYFLLSITLFSFLRALCAFAVCFSANSTQEPLSNYVFSLWANEYEAN